MSGFGNSSFGSSGFSTIEEWVAPPTSSSDTGTKGQSAYDGTYFYKCVDTDTWVYWAVVTSF